MEDDRGQIVEKVGDWSVGSRGNACMRARACVCVCVCMEGYGEGIGVLRKLNGSVKQRLAHVLCIVY